MSGWAAGTAGEAGPWAATVDGMGAALALLVDELAHGVLVVSPLGQLLHTNLAARRELSRRQVLASLQGQLLASDPQQNRQLLQALAKAGKGRRSLLVLRSSCGWRLSIAVLPLQGEGRPQPTAVALVLSRAALCDTLMLCFFARTHGLTPTEEQVLALLCAGCSAPEVAQQLKVAVSTIRSHVRGLCTKTQSHGVRALVGRVAALPPLGQWVQHQVH